MASECFVQTSLDAASGFRHELDLTGLTRSGKALPHTGSDAGCRGGVSIQSNSPIGGNLKVPATSSRNAVRSTKQLMRIANPI